VKIGETLYVTSRKEWRMWLAKHHRSRQEIWLVFCMKASGKPSIAYDVAVEEAICYGWIDSQQRPMDEERFARRFTPRRADSQWSESNKSRALKLLREGKMTLSGKALLPGEVRKAWNDAQGMR